MIFWTCKSMSLNFIPYLGLLPRCSRLHFGLENKNNNNKMYQLMSENKSYLKKKRASKKTRPLDQPNSPLVIASNMECKGGNWDQSWATSDIFPSDQSVNKFKYRDRGIGLSWSVVFTNFHVPVSTFQYFE